MLLGQADLDRARNDSAYVEKKDGNIWPHLTTIKTQVIPSKVLNGTYQQLINLCFMLRNLHEDINWYLEEGGKLDTVKFSFFFSSEDHASRV